MTLRPVREDDLDELYELIEANRDHLRPWMPWAGQDRAATAEFLREAASAEHPQLAIVEDGWIRGVCGFHHVDERNRATSVGYWLAADAQGRGLATGAVGALLDQAFGPLGLHRAELRAHPDNRRSRAVAERLGFAQEGVLREAERFGDGYRDLVLYAMLASDWRA